MKVILDGIVMEKYKGDAEVASYGSLHGDVGTRASNFMVLHVSRKPHHCSESVFPPT